MRVAGAVTFGEPEPVLTPSGTSPMMTNRSGAGKGNGRRRTPSTMEKMAVVAPMPKASVSIAVKVKPGAWRNRRNEYRMSSHNLFIAYLLRCRYRPFNYSVRRACMGSTEDARRAGTKHAANEIGRASCRERV